MIFVVPNQNGNTRQLRSTVKMWRSLTEMEGVLPLSIRRAINHALSTHNGGSTAVITFSREDAAMIMNKIGLAP